MKPLADLNARLDDQSGHGGAVRDMFDRIAPTYDLLNRVLSAGIDVSWRKRAIHFLKRAPKGAVLDSCAGTMDLSRLLRDSFPGDRIVAADFAPKMLEAGKAKAPSVERVVADAMDLPFKDGEFTKMICGFGMRNVADTKKGVAEARRVLAPGGVFVTLEFFRPTQLRTQAFHAAYAKVVLPTVGGLLSGDSGAYKYLAKSMKGFLSTAEYMQVLENSGFESVHSIDLTLGIASVVVGVVGES